MTSRFAHLHTKSFSVSNLMPVIYIYKRHVFIGALFQIEHHPMSQFFYIAPIKVQVSNNAFTDIAHCEYIIRQYSDLLLRANRHDNGWRQPRDDHTTSYTPPL